MSQICIAKKVAVNNVEFLDFAVNDDDQLLVFPNFKSASEFLKEQVGTGELLLDFIITTVEAQMNNSRLQELMKKPIVNMESPEVVSLSQEEAVELPELEEGTEEVECTFLLHCSDYDIKDHEVFGDKLKNRVLAPVLVFVDVTDPSKPVEVTNFALKAVYIDRLNRK
jgi:hypothetical protein